jgi:osmotically inducible protein OsmC
MCHAIAAAGFIIERLVEPETSPELAERDPEAYQLIRTEPRFLFFPSNAQNGPKDGAGAVHCRGNGTSSSRACELKAFSDHKEPRLGQSGPAKMDYPSGRQRGGTMPAKGSAEWKGDLPTGSGTFTAGDTISGGYTFKSRFEDGPGSNPEQLIAAAHAACFSMALSNALAKAGHPPLSVQTNATVTLRPVDGTPTITKIALVTVGRVPGLDEAAFTEHATAAKAGCPVSRALASVPEITLEASLAP